MAAKKATTGFTPTKKKKHDGILYAHVTGDNVAHMKTRAKAAGLSLSEYTDQLLTKLRTDKVI